METKLESPTGFGSGQRSVIPDVRKIACLRANAIGDYVFTLPALAALRGAYPEAQIVLLGQRWHARFMRERPGPVDRVIAVPEGWLQAMATGELTAPLRAFFEAMQAERFDVALQLYGGGTESNRLIQGLEPRVSAGLRSAGAAGLDRWVPYQYWQREVLRLLEVVALVGATPTTLEPRLRVTERDLAEAAAVVPETHGPLVVLHPGAGDPRRRWPAAKFAAVGDALADTGAHIVVTGVVAEASIVEQVTSKMRAPVQDLSGRLSLGALAGLLSRASVVISNDSGPLHLAGAVGAATVGIYWVGNVVNAGPMTSARHRICMSWELACPTCGRHCVYDNCTHRPSFVGSVPVDAVLDHARALLELWARPRSGAGRMARDG